MNQNSKIQKIMVVEDDVQDFEMLEEYIQEGTPYKTEIINAKNLAEMWAQIHDFQPDMLFQDIHVPISESEEGDGKSGLLELNDVSNSFPDMPVVINSGYTLESSSEIFRLMNLPRFPLVAVLEKKSYEQKDVNQAIGNATLFRMNVNNWLEERLEQEKRDKERAESREGKFRDFFDESKDILVRLEIEKRQNSEGLCPYLFGELGRTLERTISNALGDRFEKFMMTANINRLCAEFNISKDHEIEIGECWKLRNHFTHNFDQQVETIENARRMNRIIEMLHKKLNAS